VLSVINGGCAAPGPAQVARFVESAPRYTSYPSANHFTRAFGAAEAAGQLASVAREGRGEPLSLYLHVPYCSSLCWYCGCNVVVTRRRERGAAYVDALGAELGLLAGLAESGRPVAELAIGGGSPNFLATADLRRLFAAVRRHFSLMDDAEVSVELDPRETSEDQIAALADLGLTRLSVGVQDFDPAVQQAVHRFQSEEQTRRLLDWARRCGVHRINVDLVYGLPRQTPESLSRTLEQVISLAPRRIAVFGYAHVPELRPHQRLVERAGPLPDAAARAELFALVGSRLAAAGYVAIGIDHFALPEDALARAAATGQLDRNFQGYAERRATCLLACGPTGISDSGGAYWQNEADVATWEARVRGGELPVARGIALTADDRLRRDVIMRLMCDAAVDFADVERRAAARERGDHPIRFEEYFAPELEQLLTDDRDHLARVDRDARRIEALPLGRLLLRNIARVFDAYHRQGGAPGRFSPTL
jgi:oxygen-independent coproporphyrinogen III oxidase